jgi:protein tyrosine phosphatase (PTP) superfamily phosphohydrolase (DUF442 family)
MPLRINSKVLSGGQPDGEAAFQELQSLGIKTLISVDGASPNVALAEKYGLRYVHLPHGYDGISKAQQASIAKAVRDLPGPIYVHCHHGKHRSPAAAATACRALGWLTAAQAMSALNEAGTSPNYRGLFQTVEDTVPFDDEFLNGLSVEFRSVVDLPPIAKTMVAMEHALDHLKLLGKNEWQPLESHPDLNAAHEALILREHFTEFLRTESEQTHAEGFVKLMREGETIVGRLELSLRDDSLSDASDALKSLVDNCTQCHRQFRDVPLGEKSNVTRD